MCWFSIADSASGAKVTQSPPEISISEGMEATLSCSYDETAYAVFWYLQKPGKSPQFILQDFTKNEDLNEEYKDRFNANHDKATKQFPLSIKLTKITDSGTYLCAMRPTLCDELEAVYNKLVTVSFRFYSVPLGGSNTVCVYRYQSEINLGEVITLTKTQMIILICYHRIQKVIVSLLMQSKFH
ncbi:hypothetical protein XELAEV_18007231mg [Xenopus laevis]|uniref:Ig-like domain-containing protein n=1 Tax=Xenopus laevis TaxID=8355 RepID=A0A974E1Y6_XENLA|nr:hypothetical protein XELAEV_18007231mg [Xenopus laevis]